ncbi:MAG: hypothetical protein A3F67_10455 [Verrucomicrobia bacterium RIFCSPHIGHO2_12_FULL_41_10]|nr:MAG: hypothetical protein A3F67_10455 [Verrucomicrobia bacterium RIFCSPHIGHO2_12_FULL_41_10]
MSVAGSSAFRPVGESLGDLGSTQIASIGRVITETSDLSTKVFSYLNHQDLQEAVSTSRLMQVSIITAANTNESALVREFIQQVIDTLNPDKLPLQIQSFREISLRCNGLRFDNLRTLGEFTSTILEQLIEVIQTLPRETIDFLEFYVETPELMDFIFKISLFKSRISEARRILDGTAAIRARNAIYLELRDHSADLARAGHIDRAIAIAKIMHPDVRVNSDLLRADALRDISTILANAGNIKRAIAVAEMIRAGDIVQRGQAFRGIALALARGGNIRSAIHISDRISCDASLFNLTTEDIADVIVQCNDIESDIENICTTSGGSKVWLAVPVALVKAGHVEKAIEIAKRIHFLSRDEIFRSISIILAKTSNHEKAMEVASRIVDRYTRETAGLLVSRERYKHVYETVRKLAENGNLEEAIEMALTIPDTESSSGLALGKVSVCLAETGDFERAINLALGISDCVGYKDQALRTISVTVARAGNIFRAVEIASMIGDEEIKMYAMSDIAAI